MINEIRAADLDWHKNKVVAAPKRGNMALVSYALKRSEAYGDYHPQKTRCVWPGSMLNGDSRILSRRLAVKTF